MRMHQFTSRSAFLDKLLFSTREETHSFSTPCVFEFAVLLKWEITF